jgi:O-antigen/teichoic acid export membrane protein
VLRSALVALPVPIVLIAAGPFLFAIVFGEEWREAGEYARILAPWMFLDLIRAPIVQVGSIVRKQQQVLYFSIVSSVLLLVSIFAGLHFFKSDPRMIFVIISASQSVMTLVLILLVLRISRTKAPGEIV